MIHVGDVFERTSKKGLGQRVKVVNIQRGNESADAAVIVNPLVNVRNVVSGRRTVMYLKRLEGSRFRLVMKGK
jgi:hypothetical protein